MIVGTDGSRFYRIGPHLHYLVNGHTGMIRDFNGRLYDGNRYLGAYINGEIVMEGMSRIKFAEDRVFTASGEYTLDRSEETLSFGDKMWFEIRDKWDAMRIALWNITRQGIS